MKKQKHVFLKLSKIRENWILARDYFQVRLFCIFCRFSREYDPKKTVREKRAIFRRSGQIEKPDKREKSGKIPPRDLYFSQAAILVLTRALIFQREKNGAKKRQEKFFEKLN